jgi:PAS domain S-box-containing protein
MSTIDKNSGQCILIGVLLAIFGGVAWWLGTLSATGPRGELGPALGLGILAAVLAAGLTLFLGWRSDPPTVAKAKEEAAPELPEEMAQPALRKRRRHPLDRHAYRARLTAALRLQAVSKSLATLLRGDKSRLAGTPFFQHLHPEDVPAVDKAFAQARTSRQMQQVMCRLLRAEQDAVSKNGVKSAGNSDTDELPRLASGSMVHSRLEIWPWINRAGKARGFDCRFIDLTAMIVQKNMELKTARKMLKNAKRRWRAAAFDLERLKLSYQELYQNAPVMYFSMDHEGKLVTCNDTLVRTLGYSRKELRSRSYTMLLAPATLKSYVTIAEAMPAQEGELETQWCKKDGTVIDVWLHTLPVYDDAGRIVRYRSAALDLSEKNRLSHELRARGDELERTNQRLRTINSELEAFTHVVSHDLKEPLRTLQAYSHILAEEHASEIGPDGFQYINHLVRASRRLGTLIDELLNLSQAGRITHAPRIFNINEIVATVRQDLVDLIQRKQAIILTEGSLPNVIGDTVRITQLLTNLVANGLKYNQNPQPKVFVGALAASDESGRVTIFVRDNGIGIDPSFHTQIFGIFRRLHQDGEYEGTGAGLAICKKIVEGHGGRIWVESELGSGATFLFTLPRPPKARPHHNAAGELPGEAQPPSKPRRTAIHAEDAAGKGPRIVLVEDQADVGMIIQKLGKRDGLDITWFPTAEEAWIYLQEQRVDLLLLDVNLPGMNGVELCKRLRAIEHCKDTPVALFTPDQDPEKLEELRRAGADYFLTKDLLCEPAEWQRNLQNLLEQIREPASH